jgi:short-subunit dehydrogenase
MSAPTMGAYSASKAAMLSFSETLYTELHDTDVSVTVMLPYFFQTGFFKSGSFSGETERKAAQQALEGSRMTAQRVASQAVRAMYRKRLYASAPFREGRLAWWIKRRFPLALLDYIAREGRRQLSMIEE